MAKLLIDVSTMLKIVKNLNRDLRTIEKEIEDIVKKKKCLERDLRKREKKKNNSRKRIIAYIVKKKVLIETNLMESPTHEVSTENLQLLIKRDLCENENMSKANNKKLERRRIN